MADIRNDQYLHRPGVGRGAIMPTDPLEVLLHYGGQPISGTNRLPVEATLSGSLVPDAQPVPTKSVSRTVLVTQIGTAVTLGAGVNAVIALDDFMDGVDSIALTVRETSNAPHSWRVIVDYRVAPEDDFSVSPIEATSTGATAAVVRHQVRTARAYYRIHNQDTVSRTYNVFVTKWY